MTDAQKPGVARKSSGGFSAEERAAMKERAREVKAPARRGQPAGKAGGESDALAKIAEMPEADRVMAERIHALIRASVPALAPKTWYGMPAYCKGSDMICFFQGSAKFKSRFAMLGFSDKASLDEGEMRPVYYAITQLTPSVEARIIALVRKAAS